MTSRKTAFIMMVVAAVLLAIIGLRGLTPRDAADSEATLRNSLVLGYLIRVEIGERSFDASFQPVLDRIAEEIETQETVGRAAAVLLIHEGKEDAARQLIDRLAAGDQDVALLRFAMGDDVPLPDNWEQTVVDDWAGARLRVMIHERLEDRPAASSARLDMFDEQGEARNLDRIQNVRNILSLIGLGLLISMFLSDRQWKRLGKTDFFKLTPLYFDNAVAFRFCAWFFVGVFAISLMMPLFGELETWAEEVVAALLYILWGVFLLKRLVFREHRDVAENMGLSNLRMHPFNLIQIFGGFAMVVACHFYGELIASMINWPTDYPAYELKYRQILENPIARPVYVLMACIIAPLFEEVIFRGLILRVLLNNMRPQAALWSSALIFAVLHPLPLWPVILFKGFALAVIYYRTANLLVVVWTHALWNMAVLLVSISSLGALS